MKNLILGLIVVLLGLTLYIVGQGETENMRKDFNRSFKEIRLTVHTFKDKKSLLNATKKYKTTQEKGFSVWSNGDNICDIYVVKPRTINSSEFETWGHELGHCIYGSFHGDYK